MCSGRQAAGRRQTHTRVMTPSRSPWSSGLCRLLRGGERSLLGGQEPASEEAGHRLRELRDLKRQRLPKCAPPALLSVSSARCSVLSFSSCIHLKESKTHQLPSSAQERFWTTNLGWHSVSRRAIPGTSAHFTSRLKGLTFPLLNILKLGITSH